MTLGEVIQVAIPEDHQSSSQQSKSATRGPMAGSPSGGARAAAALPMKIDQKRERDRQNQERIEHSLAGQAMDMASHYHEQSAQIRSRSVDTWNQQMVPGFSGVDMASARAPEGEGWRQRMFGVSASGTSWGDSQQQGEQLLASRGWRPMPRATSTPNRIALASRRLPVCELRVEIMAVRAVRAEADEEC